MLISYPWTNPEPEHAQQLTLNMLILARYQLFCASQSFRIKVSEA